MLWLLALYVRSYKALDWVLYLRRCNNFILCHNINGSLLCDLQLFKQNPTLDMIQRVLTLCSTWSLINHKCRLALTNFSESKPESGSETAEHLLCNCDALAF